jgi:hypothetical protein
MLRLYDFHGRKGEMQFFCPGHHTGLKISFYTYVNTYHSRFMPEWIAEASQILLRDTIYLNYLAMISTADVIGGKPIAV